MPPPIIIIAANLLSNPFLSKLLINDADIYKELDIYDFVPKTVSPFALLLTDQDSMKVAVLEDSDASSSNSNSFAGSKPITSHSLFRICAGLE